MRGVRANNVGGRPGGRIPKRCTVRSYFKTTETILTSAAFH